MFVMFDVGKDLMMIGLRTAMHGSTMPLEI